MGMGVFSLKFEHFNGAFICWALIGCFIGRFFCIYPISYAYNSIVTKKNRLRSIRRSQASTEEARLLNSSYTSSMINRLSLSKSFRDQDDLVISPKLMHMLWFSGLRGAVAYAC